MGRGEQRRLGQKKGSQEGKAGKQEVPVPRLPLVPLMQKGHGRQKHRATHGGFQTLCPALGAVGHTRLLLL